MLQMIRIKANESVFYQHTYKAQFRVTRPGWPEVYINMLAHVYMSYGQSDSLVGIECWNFPRVPRMAAHFFHPVTIVGSV